MTCRPDTVVDGTNGNCYCKRPNTAPYHCPAGSGGDHLRARPWRRSSGIRGRGSVRATAAARASAAALAAQPARLCRGSRSMPATLRRCRALSGPSSAAGAAPALMRVQSECIPPGRAVARALVHLRMKAVRAIAATSGIRHGPASPQSRATKASGLQCPDGTYCSGGSLPHRGTIVLGLTTQQLLPVPWCRSLPLNSLFH